MTKSIGLICLAIFLILYGLMTLLPATNIMALVIIRAIVALVAAALLLIGK